MSVAQLEEELEKSPENVPSELFSEYAACHFSKGEDGFRRLEKVLPSSRGAAKAAALWAKPDGHSAQDERAALEGWGLKRGNLRIFVNSILGSYGDKGRSLGDLGGARSKRSPRS